MTVASDVKAPLVVYVVWHPGFQDGRVLADRLFAELCANVERTTARNLQIAVRYRTADTGAIPPEIDFALYQRSAVFVLYDVESAADGRWRDYVDAIADSTPDSSIVVPVCFTNAEQLPERLRLHNAIQATDVPDEDRWPLLRNRALHALCRLLDDEAKKVLVFLSHAKRDGRETTASIKAYLDGHAWLDSFFDEADIPDGGRFADVIIQAADMAPVLLAVHTDEYSSREWCRLEVLEAKRRGVPVVVLSATSLGEDRTFPYLGNVPVARWNGPASMPEVVGTLLRQVLRRRYFKVRVDYLSQLRQSDVPECRLEPPELLTALLAIHDDGAAHPYLYPDPPLGTEELELLRQLDPAHEPMTPTTWWAS